MVVRVLILRITHQTDSARVLFSFAMFIVRSRESLFLVPSPDFRPPERAEGVKGPKCYAELGGFFAA
jgi:hypothetical protein